MNTETATLLEHLHQAVEVASKIDGFPLNEVVYADLICEDDGA